jgi:predicted nucleotide-binding protein
VPAARPPAAATGAPLDDASQHYFVAHEFSAEKRDDLRRAIEEALADSGLRPYYADAELRQGHIFMDKILPKIRHTRFGIYDISNPKKPNVFLELGAAIAMGQPYFIICKSDTEIPADLQGLDRIEYQSYSHLSDQLRAKIPKPSGGRS